MSSASRPPSRCSVAANGEHYSPTLPVRPAFCRASKTSESLKSPVTVKLSAPLTASVGTVTPETSPSALFTALTQLGQHRWTPLTLSVCTLSPLVTAETGAKGDKVQTLKVKG